MSTTNYAVIVLLGIQCELLPGNSNHGTRPSEQGHHQEPTIFNNQSLVPGLAEPSLLGETAFPGLQTALDITARTNETTLDITARTNETVFPDMFKSEQTQHLAGNTRTNIKVRNWWWSQRARKHYSREYNLFVLKKKIEAATCGSAGNGVPQIF